MFSCIIDNEIDIPSYIFPKKCDKIIVDKKSGYFINSDNIHCIDFNNLKFADIPTTTLFNVKVIIGIDLIRDMYKHYIKYNSTLVIENSGDKFKIFYDDIPKDIDKLIYSNIYSDRLDDYRIKIPSRWLKDILPLMSLINCCEFYFKPNFPLVIAFHIQLFALPDMISRMFIFVSPIEE